MSDHGWMMCPECGALCGKDPRTGLTRVHKVQEDSAFPCAGSGQNPRYALSDGRPLWSGQPNPHFGKAVRP